MRQRNDHAALGVGVLVARSSRSGGPVIKHPKTGKPLYTFHINSEDAKVSKAHKENGKSSDASSFDSPPGTFATRLAAANRASYQVFP